MLQSLGVILSSFVFALMTAPFWPFLGAVFLHQRLQGRGDRLFVL